MDLTELEDLFGTAADECGVVDFSDQAEVDQTVAYHVGAIEDAYAMEESFWVKLPSKEIFYFLYRRSSRIWRSYI